MVLRLEESDTKFTAHWVYQEREKYLIKKNLKLPFPIARKNRRERPFLGSMRFSWSAASVISSLLRNMLNIACVLFLTSHFAHMQLKTWPFLF